MSYYPEFAETINQTLHKEDRTASWLATRLGVSPSTVTRWRNGDSRPRTPEQVIRIADILGIHVEERIHLLAAAGYGYQEVEPVDEKPMAEMIEDEPAVDVENEIVDLPDETQVETIADIKDEPVVEQEDEIADLSDEEEVEATLDSDESTSGGAVLTHRELISMAYVIALMLTAVISTRLFWYTYLSPLQADPSTPTPPLSTPMPVPATTTPTPVPVTATPISHSMKTFSIGMSHSDG